MATLLSAVTSDSTGTGASHTGPCSVVFHDDSVFDGATITLEAADTDTAADYAPIRDPETGLNTATATRSGVITLDIKGTYYLRAVVTGAGSATNLTCVSIQ